MTNILRPSRCSLYPLALLRQNETFHRRVFSLQKKKSLRKGKGSVRTNQALFDEYSAKDMAEVNDISDIDESSHSDDDIITLDDLEA